MILDHDRDGGGGPISDAVLIGRDFYKFSGSPPDSLPVPLDSFLIPKAAAYVSRNIGYDHQIVVNGLPWPRSNFLSTLFRNKHTSSIVVHHTLDRDFTRFAVAIELGNVILSDNESYNTTDILTHLTGLLSGLNSERDTPLYGEGLAIGIAIELLMPMHHRAAMDNFIAAGTDVATIARSFGVPEYIVEWSLAGGWQHRVRLHEIIRDQPPQPPDQE